MALDYFKKKKVEIAIIETGLGGRLDSTNIIKPKIAVITSISMDHMEILGSSLKKIAYEKAGIIKRRVPTVTAIQEKPVLEIVSQVTSVKESELTVVKLPSEVNIKSSGTEFIYKGIFYKTALSGFHQAQNASLAIETLKILDPQIETRVIKTSFNNVKWPGRLEKLSSYIYYDVAHNVSGITKMVSFFKKVYPDKKIFGVFGLKSDKDLDLIFDILENNFSMLYIVTDRKKMLKDKFELSKKLDCRNIPNKPMESVKEGITNLKKIKINNEIGIIFGTHYIAEEVYNEFELSFDRGLI
jgi:dihydrofolate synthase/folylpolyglutamate synthase